MKTKSWLVSLVVLSCAACSSADKEGTSTDPETPDPVDTDPPVFDYENEDVQMDTDSVVPAGSTGRIGPGVTIRATADNAIRVEGVLLVEGTAESKVQFTGSGTPSSWYGIRIESGGELKLEHAEIREARYGIHTLPGSEFTVDYADIGGGFKAAIVESDGTFDHSLFAAAPATEIAITVPVTIDDPNGTMTIMDASPTVTNSRFVGASVLTDLVRIGGESSPVFDHVHLSKAHCAFHNFGAVNNSPLVKNSVLSEFSYGVMAFGTKPIFENNVFEKNTNDVGLCLGAAAENAPVLTGNYYAEGAPLIDAGCASIGTVETSAASAPIAGAGPVGL